MSEKLTFSSMHFNTKISPYKAHPAFLFSPVSMFYTICITQSYGTVTTNAII